MKNKIAVVVGLVDKIDGLKITLMKAVPRAFPIGTVVHWEHGKQIRSGVVDMHSRWRATEVRVELRTGSTKWIGITQLLEFYTSGD